MKFPHGLTGFGLSVAGFLALGLSTAQAGPVPSGAGVLAEGQGVASLIESVQYNYKGRTYRGNRYGRGNRGAAVGAGIAAGVLGGMVLGSVLNNRQSAAPVYDEGPVYVEQPRRRVYSSGGDSVEYCLQRYRSYNIQTGTYIGYDGIERPCP